MQNTTTQSVIKISAAPRRQAQSHEIPNAVTGGVLSSRKMGYHEQTNMSCRMPGRMPGNIEQNMSCRMPGNIERNVPGRMPGRHTMANYRGTNMPGHKEMNMQGHKEMNMPGHKEMNMQVSRKSIMDIGVSPITYQGSMNTMSKGSPYQGSQSSQSSQGSQGSSHHMSITYLGLRLSCQICPRVAYSFSKRFVGSSKSSQVVANTAKQLATNQSSSHPGSESSPASTSIPPHVTIPTAEVVSDYTPSSNADTANYYTEQSPSKPTPPHPGKLALLDSNAKEYRDQQNKQNFEDAAELQNPSAGVQSYTYSPTYHNEGTTSDIPQTSTPQDILKKVTGNPPAESYPTDNLSHDNKKAYRAIVGPISWSTKSRNHTTTSNPTNTPDVPVSTPTSTVSDVAQDSNNSQAPSSDPETSNSSDVAVSTTHTSTFSDVTSVADIMTESSEVPHVSIPEDFSDVAPIATNAPVPPPIPPRPLVRPIPCSDSPIHFNHLIYAKAADRASCSPSIETQFATIEEKRNTVTQTLLQDLSFRKLYNYLGDQKTGQLTADFYKTYKKFCSHKEIVTIPDNITSFPFGIGVISFIDQEQTLLLHSIQKHFTLLYTAQDDSIIIWAYLTSFKGGADGLTIQLSDAQPFDDDKTKSQYLCTLKKPIKVLKDHIKDLDPELQIIANTYINQPQIKHILETEFKRTTIPALKSPVHVYDGTGVIEPEARQVIESFDQEADKLAKRWLIDFKAKLNQSPDQLEEHVFEKFIEKRKQANPKAAELFISLYEQSKAKTK